MGWFHMRDSGMWPRKTVGYTVNDFRDTSGDDLVRRQTELSIPLVPVTITMSNETEDIRVWLVERGYNNRDLIILKYATPDGDRLFRRELAAQVVDMDSVTASRDVSPNDLEAVDDQNLQERYEAEADRMADKHDPDDLI